MAKVIFLSKSNETFSVFGVETLNSQVASVWTKMKKIDELSSVNVYLVNFSFCKYS